MNADGMSLGLGTVEGSLFHLLHSPCQAARVCGARQMGDFKPLPSINGACFAGRILSGGSTLRRALPRRSVRSGDPASHQLLQRRRRQ